MFLNVAMRAMNYCSIFHTSVILSLILGKNIWESQTQITVGLYFSVMLVIHFTVWPSSISSKCWTLSWNVAEFCISRKMSIFYTVEVQRLTEENSYRFLTVYPFS